MEKEYYYHLIESEQALLIKESLLHETDNNQLIYAFEKAFCSNKNDILDIIIDSTLLKNELSVANYQLSFLIKENSSDIQSYLEFNQLNPSKKLISWENIFREIFKHDSHHSFVAIQPFIPHDNNQINTLFSTACANNSLKILEHISLLQVSENDFIIGLVSAQSRGFNEVVHYAINSLIENSQLMCHTDKIYQILHNDPELTSIENKIRLNKNLHSDLNFKDNIKRAKV